MQTTATSIDQRDSEIVRQRLNELEKIDGPRIGDYIVFADGTERRISHIWFDEDVQTSDGGSFYLGDGYVSFSGSLHRSVPSDSLTLTPEVRDGSCWIFHHDLWGAGRGVDMNLLCWNVYRCDMDAPR